MNMGIVSAAQTGAADALTWAALHPELAMVMVLWTAASTALKIYCGAELFGWFRKKFKG